MSDPIPIPQSKFSISYWLRSADINQPKMEENPTEADIFSMDDEESISESSSNDDANEANEAATNTSSDATTNTSSDADTNTSSDAATNTSSDEENDAENDKTNIYKKTFKEIYAEWYDDRLEEDDIFNDTICYKKFEQLYDKYKDVIIPDYVKIWTFGITCCLGGFGEPMMYGLMLWVFTKQVDKYAIESAIDSATYECLKKVEEENQ